MVTRFVTASAKGSTKDSYAIAKRAAEEAMKKLGKKPDLVILYCDPSCDVEKVVGGVREVTEKAPLIGCASVGEFTEEREDIFNVLTDLKKPFSPEELERGNVALALIASDDMRFFPAIAENLKEDPEKAIEDLKNALPAEVKGFQYRYGLLYMDAFVGLGEAVVLTASLDFPETPFFGGGAIDGGVVGNLIEPRNRYVFLNDAVTSDAAAMCLIFSKKRLGLSIVHSAIPAFGPFEVTKAEGNIVHELDHRPAWDVLRESIAGDLKKRYGIDVSQIDQTRAEAISVTHYALAYRIDENNYKLRWGMRAGRSLAFTTDILEGTRIYGMTFIKKALIEDSRKACEAAMRSIDGKPAGALITEAAARGITLSSSIGGTPEDFARAIKEIRKGINAPLLGFENMGGVYMIPGHFSGFYTGSIQVMVFPE